MYSTSSSGAERTGAVHMGYLIRYMNKKYSEALEIASNPVGAPNADYLYLVQEYCKKEKENE